MDKLQHIAGVVSGGPHFSALDSMLVSACPWSRSVLALAPYLGVGFYFLKRDLLAASVFCHDPDTSPARIRMLTTMPRGFVTGLCFWHCPHN